MKFSGIVPALALAIVISASLAAEPLTLLDAGGTTLRFIDTTAPSVSLGTVTVTGMQPTEVLAAIDYRPATGALYGVGVVASGEARLYTIDPATGVAVLVGAGAFHPIIGLSQIGMDFNPVTDRIRLISNVGFNLRVNPNDGTATTDTNVAFAAGDPNESNDNSPLGIAYSNNVAGAPSTTLYGIVLSAGPVLVTIGSPGGAPVSPNSGQMFTVGPTGLVGYFSFQQGMDISRSGVAYMVVDNNNVLYSVNLATGQATALGTFPVGSVIMGMSAPITAAAAAAQVPTLDARMLLALTLLLAVMAAFAIKA